MRSPLITPLKKNGKGHHTSIMSPSIALNNMKTPGVHKQKYRSPAGGSGFTPLITPSPRRSPRIAGMSPANFSLFSFSPLISNELFVSTSLAADQANPCVSTLSLTQRYKPASQPATVRGNGDSDSSGGYSLFTNKVSLADEHPVKSTCTRTQRLLQSDQPIPVNEPKRSLKIMLRSGLREMNQLADELNTKASVSSMNDSTDAIVIDTDDAEKKSSPTSQLEKSTGSSGKRSRKSLSFHRKSSKLSIRSENDDISEKENQPTVPKESNKLTHKVFRKIFKKTQPL